MDVELTEDQELLRSTTRRFLEAECPLSAVRALEGDPAGFDADYWRRGAELGWMSMLVPEADGGGSLSGEPLRDLVIVAEEMGHLVSPGPFVPTNVVAAAVAEHGTADQRADVLGGIVSGDTVAAWSVDPGPRLDAHDVACQAVAAGDGFVLSGVTKPVEAAAQAQVLLVAARSDAGLTQYLVPSDAAGVTITPLDGIDLVRRFAEVRLDDVEVPASGVIGELGGAGDAIGRQLDTALVLQCAETCGIIDRVLELTLEYVDDRYSFGRPLSSYQALKHRFADMKMWVEACHTTTTAATIAVEHRTSDATELVSVAKAYVGNIAVEIIQDCVQMHGGIGVTWEHDIHLYLRRATLHRQMYGSPAQHRERLAVLLGMGELRT